MVGRMLRNRTVEPGQGDDVTLFREGDDEGAHHQPEQLHGVAEIDDNTQRPEGGWETSLNHGANTPHTEDGL
jgi:hypothetical protein